VLLLLARSHLIFVELQVLIVAALLHLLHEVLIIGFHSGVILLVLIIPTNVYGAENLPQELIPSDAFLFQCIIYGGTRASVSDLMIIIGGRFPSQRLIDNGCGSHGHHMATSIID
jgi:hypothetical protein